MTLKRALLFSFFLFSLAAALTDFEVWFVEPADYSLNSGNGLLQVVLGFNETGTYSCNLGFESSSSGFEKELTVKDSAVVDWPELISIPGCPGGRHGCWHDLAISCEKTSGSEAGASVPNSSRFHYYLVEAGCTDFDAGEPFPKLVASACSDASGLHHDYCDGNELKEFYCSSSSDSCIKQNIVCEDGCASGACVFVAPANPLTCVVLPGGSGPGDEPISGLVPVLLEVDQPVDLPLLEPQYHFLVRDWGEDVLWLSVKGGSESIFLNKGVEMIYDAGRLRLVLKGFSRSGGKDYAELDYLISEEDDKLLCLNVLEPHEQPYSSLPIVRFRLEKKEKGVLSTGPAYKCGVFLNDGAPTELQDFKVDLNKDIEIDLKGSYQSYAVDGVNELKVSCHSDSTTLESLVEFTYSGNEEVVVIYPKGDYEGETPLSVSFEFAAYGHAELYDCEYRFKDADAFHKYPYQVPSGYSASGSWLLPQGEYVFTAQCAPAGSEAWLDDSEPLTVFTNGKPSITKPSTRFVWGEPIEIGFKVYGGEFQCSYDLDGETTELEEPVSQWSGEVSPEPGEHVLSVSCGGKADSRQFISGLEGVPVMLWPANNSNYSYNGDAYENASVYFYFALSKDAECSYSAGGLEGSIDVTAEEVQEVLLEFPEGNYSFELQCGEDSPKQQIDFSVLNVQDFLVNEPVVAEPMKDYTFVEPGFGLRFFVSGSYQEYSCVPSVTRVMTLSGTVNEEPKEFDAIKVSNGEEFRDDAYFSGFETGLYEFSLECYGLKDGARGESNETVVSFGVELQEVEKEEAPKPAPPRSSLPTPTTPPADELPSFVIDCPKQLSKNSTHVYAVMQADGEPVCDNDLVISVSVGGAEVDADLVKCSQATGKHDVLIDSSAEGTYLISLESKAHGLSDSCEVNKIQLAGGEEEAPALPLLLALAAAAIAFAKRRQ
ncbi:hypothetical protein COT57_03600 [Candidatus Micrarchaeota archaeon CG09_land_8_20_14_0_10_55_25]|nr:MAG: hypothetical protein AUJ15_00845 [Candidatus Micrarchaeota archaeon CG1_02_55_41]PIO02480.1 MAG: hypothetical protein COT57_03600 [Candidatus Micrarchaeota archaeon CG09_land_8_20_14_0_10_55_25]